MDFFFEIPSSEDQDQDQDNEQHIDPNDNVTGIIGFHDGTGKKTNEAIHWIIFMYALHIPFIFSLNATVMIIIILVRKFHTSDNYILFAMALVDFMCGFANIMVILEIDHDILRLLRGTKEACMFRLGFNAFWYNNSLSLMMVMCIERNLAIMSPFWYQMHVCEKTVIKSILFVMAIEFITSCVMLVSLFNYDVSEPNLLLRCQRSSNTPNWYGHYFKVIKIGLQLTITVVLSLRVYIVALKQLISTSRTGSHLSGYTDEQSGQQIQQVKLMMVLVGVFVLLWLPIMFNPVVFATQTIGFSEIYRASSRHFLYLNSSVNPVIYVFRKPAFRKAYRFLLTSQPRHWKNLSVFIAQDQNAHTTTNRGNWSDSSYKKRQKTYTTRSLTTDNPTAQEHKSSIKGTVTNISHGLDTSGAPSSCSTGTSTLFLQTSDRPAQGGSQRVFSSAVRT